VIDSGGVIDCGDALIDVLGDGELGFGGGELGFGGSGELERLCAVQRLCTECHQEAVWPMVHKVLTAGAVAHHAVTAAIHDETRQLRRRVYRGRGMAGQASLQSAKSHGRQ